MSIVSMKHLNLIALRRDRTCLLSELQRLGCAQIDEPKRSEEDSEELWASLKKAPNAADAIREKEERALRALEAVKKYGKVKDSGFIPRPIVPEETFFDDSVYKESEELVDQITRAEEDIALLASQSEKLQREKESLAPWLATDVPVDSTGTRSVSVVFGTLSRTTDPEELLTLLGDDAPLVDLTVVSEDSALRYVMAAAHRSVADAAFAVMQQQGFSRTVFRSLSGTAAENSRRMDGELRAAAEKTRSQEEFIASFADRYSDLKMYIDRTRQDVEKEEAKGRLWDTRQTFCLTGWIEESEEGALADLLSRYTCAWETSAPEEDEYPSVPVRLKNGKVTAPLNMVTEMYALPAYGTVDPNPIMAPFFIFFYGFMMADMGYGLIMMLVSFISMKRLRPKGPTVRYMIPLLGLCGISTFVMGAATGSFFGDLIPQLLKMFNPQSTFALPALFSPLDDALAVLIASLGIGLVQIFTGMAVSMRQKIKKGEVMAALCQEGAWYLIFALAAAGIVTGFLKPCLIAVVVVLLLTQGYGKKGFGGKLMGIGGSLYNNITGYFSDILSYSRLMALMLAGAVIAQVFNTLGGITGNPVTFFVISLIGNALNFALNILGCYVHDMRLQCLEFFGRFYEDGGKPFRPLNINTKYVDIQTNKGVF